MALLKKGGSEYFSESGLEELSPKFLKMLRHLMNPQYEGLHLIYSQFRTIEGVGVIKLMLEANGFAAFKIKQIGDDWTLDIAEDDIEKPKFVLYTGSETPEEKEIIRNVFNGNFEYLPRMLKEQLTSDESLGYKTNKFGEIIKIFIITAGGAEGISLKNVRFVHITEPYWHPVRMNQVIGRARRICSHQDLEPEFRNVKVFLYMAVIPDELLEGGTYKELKTVDDGLTSDQKLHETCIKKTKTANDLLKAIKETAIDCLIHSKGNKSEKLTCYNVQYSNKNERLFLPGNLSNDNDAAMLSKNEKEMRALFTKVRYRGVTYAYDEKTRKAYDYDAYNNDSNVHILVGTFNKSETTGKMELEEAH